MNLRDKLIQNRFEAEEAKRKATEEKAAAQQRKLDKERKAIQYMFDNAVLCIEADILAGKEPQYKVKQWELKKYLDDVIVSSRKAEDRLMWIDFCARLHSVGLKPRILNEHDGMGMESWRVIAVDPINK